MKYGRGMHETARFRNSRLLYTNDLFPITRFHRMWVEVVKLRDRCINERQTSFPPVQQIRIVFRKRSIL